MANKKRSASSNRWLQEHFKDKYVQLAKDKKLRSRAWFKLEERQRRDNLFPPGATVIDLGAAPGGWSQYVVKEIGGQGSVIACDLLPMEPIIGVDFFQGDFRDERVLKELLQKTANKKVQVVMSDMAPNMSGIIGVDIPKSMYLVELALDICRYVLAPGGNFLVKIFQGDGFEQYLREIRSLFNRVKIRKPDASRGRSREVYIVAMGWKNTPTNAIYQQNS